MRAKSIPRTSNADQALRQLCGQQPQDGAVITAEFIEGVSALWSAAAEQQQQHGLQDRLTGGSTRGSLAVQVQWVPDATGQLHPYSVVPDLFDSSDDESREPLIGPRWNNLMLQLQQHYMQQQLLLQEHSAQDNQQQCSDKVHHQQQQQQQEQEVPQQQQQQQLGTQTPSQGMPVSNGLMQPTAEQQQQQQQPNKKTTQDEAAADKAQQEATAAAAAWPIAKRCSCQNCGASHSLSWTQITTGRTSKWRCNSCTQHYKATGKHRAINKDNIVLVPPPAAVAAALAAAAGEHGSSAALNVEQAHVPVCHNCSSCITPFYWSRQCNTAAAAAADGLQQQQDEVLLCNSCAQYQRLAGKPRSVLESDRAAAHAVARQLAAAAQHLQQQRQQLQHWLAEQHKRLQLQRQRTQRSRANKRQQQQRQQQSSGLQDSSAAAAAGRKRKEQHASMSSARASESQQQVKKSKIAAAAVGKPPKPAPAYAAAAAAAAAGAGSSRQRQQQCSTGITVSANSSSSGASQLPQLSSSMRDGTAGTKPRNGAGAKPPPFKLLQRNKYVFRQRAAVETDDISVCNCQPSKGQCCREADDCLNRALKVCCTPGTCPAADACQNTTLTKRQLPGLSVVPVGSKGWGVEAQQDIQAGTLVAEYLGEVVPVSEGIKRLAAYAAKGLKHTYLMDLSKAEVIDATMKGGLARFINHSCEPNCETQKWQDGGELVIAIVAMKDIPAGTELTYDYRYQSHAVPHARTRCCCGAASCSGWLGSLDPQAHLQAQLEQHHREAVKRVVKQVDAVTGEEYHVDVLDPMDSDDDGV